MARNYSKVTNECRERLIKLISEGKTIKNAAIEIDIKYENAKAIYRVYRNESRISKRKGRLRYKKGEDRNSLESKKLAF
jgi:hypothetical protein